MILRYAGFVLIILLAGCSATHIASPTSVLPGAPSLTSQEGVNPFNLTTKHVIHKYPLPNPNSDPLYMATGPDKNVWFTEYNAARIGKITPTGVVTEYGIPNQFTGYDIAAGATNTLWFTENNNTTSKITTTGTITEYPLPPGSCSRGITKGPDGNMWFADDCASNIGKITATGTVVEYPIPSGGTPTDITAGPDGNLWFGEFSNIGKITTGGTITEYAGPTFDTPDAIAAGPDGNLYAGTTNGVWSITTAGVITNYSESTGSGWQDIILGPDKQMWLSNFTGDMIEFNPNTKLFSAIIHPDPGAEVDGLATGGDGDVWIAGRGGNTILVYEEKVTTIGIRLNGELSFTDPNYGFELGYAVGTTSTQTQTISLSMGESVQFKNVDTEPHSAAFLGNATVNSAPWPGSFNGSTTKSAAGTAIGTTGWATGSLNPNKTSPIYETGLPGFYMIGCQYHYNTNEMRTVIVVH
jgi:virginiamycin B lyase